MSQYNNIDGGGMMPGDNISDELVSKVGKAVGQIAEIKQAYRAELAVAQTDAEQQELSRRVELKAVSAINDEGLSVEQYNDVITAADDDPDLEQRLLAAARGA